MPNKEHEFQYFEQFAKTQGLPTVGAVQPPDGSGAPDILLPEMQLGVEITEWFKDGVGKKGGSMSAALMRRRREVVHKAKMAFSALRPDIKLNVALHFVGYDIRQDWDLLAERLFHWIAIPGQTIKAGESRTYEDFEGDEVLERNLAAVRVSRYDFETDHHWQTPEAGFPKASPSVIQKCIDSKNSLFEKYRAHCGELWLLIIGFGEFFDNWMYLDDESLGHVYQSEFERVFVLVANDRAIELKVSSS